MIEKVGLTTEEAERTVSLNGKASHSAWLAFMLPRIKIAQELLTSDGVIFISVDGYEDSQLRILCDEIFGSHNRISTLAWKVGAGTQAGHFTRAVESILVYAKNIESRSFFQGGEGVIEDRATKQISSKNPAGEITFPAGFPWRVADGTTLTGTWGGNEQITLVDGVMQAEDGKLLNQVTLSAGWSMANQIRNWIEGKETFDSKGQKVVGFHFNKSGSLRYVKERATIHPSQLISDKGTTSSGTDEVKELFGKVVFSFPKPTSLIEFLVSLVAEENDIVLDFFSGSASTAHAVMKMNAETNRNLRYILVQISEKIQENSNTNFAENALGLGYQSIDEIGRARIQKAADKIKTDTGADIDYGFSLFRLETPQVADLESLESFEQTEGLFDFTKDYLKEMSSGETPGQDIVLTTLFNRFRKGLTPDVEYVTLDSYKLPIVDEDAFIVSADFGKTDVHTLVTKLENEELKLNRVIVLHYSVGFSVMNTLKSGLSNMKNAKNPEVVEIF